MTIRDRILVVEDEKSISSFIRAILSTNGYEVLLASSGEMAISMISSHCPDLVILDLGLPDIDGETIIRSVRAWTQMPIIVVSARDQERDKVSALELGADDYMTKPFGGAELLARVRVAIRHMRSTGTGKSHDGRLNIGELTIDYENHQVLVGGRNAGLTHNEYRIVALLGKHAGKVLTHDYIMRELWGPAAGSSNQILRVNMANIRRKIEKNPASPRYILTEIGVGYRIIEAE